MTTVPAAKDMPQPTAPFLSRVMQIEPQWIDYNGHLNMAYYNVMMDRAIDEFWLQLGVGPAYMKERHGSTFTAECHVRYLREIHLGDPVQVTIYLLAADEKRIHTFEELRHATEGWISATSENITLHVDMGARKVAPFPQDIRDRIAARRPMSARRAGSRSSSESAAASAGPEPGATTRPSTPSRTKSRPGAETFCTQSTTQ